MRKLILLLFVNLFFYVLSYSQGLLNDGVTITINSGTSLYVFGGSANGKFTNQTNGSDGSIVIDGNMYVEGDWMNNASGGSVFTSVNNDGTVYLSGNNAQTIGGSRATSFENLTLQNNTKTLGITGSSVKGTLTVDAIFDLSSKTFIIDNKATTAITLSSNYIKSETTDGLSKIQWNTKDGTGTFLVPFKNASGVDVSISQNITVAGDAAGYMTFFTYPTNYYNQPFASPITWVSPWQSVVDRYWGVTSSSYTTQPTSNVKLYYSDADLNMGSGATNNSLITLEANLVMQRYKSATNSYEAGGGTATAASNFVNKNGLNAYGIMILSASSSPLPIELTSFSATCLDDNKKTELKWVTASETDNNYFTLEKSADGIRYNKLADIPSKNGNSNVEQDYSYIDELPYNGITYYQLKQTDYNGDSETSAPIESNCLYESSEPEVHNITYNSETGTISFIMTSPTEGHTSYYVSCYDVKGQRLVQEKLSLSNGQNSISFSSNKLNKGIYFISFMNETYSGAQKFVAY